MEQKEKLFSYLTIRGYERKWADIYQPIREELKDLGVTDPTKVSTMTPRLMSLRGQIIELSEKIKRETKFFGYDMETEVDGIVNEFLKPVSDEIDIEIPLG